MMVIYFPLMACPEYQLTVLLYSKSCPKSNFNSSVPRAILHLSSIHLTDVENHKETHSSGTHRLVDDREALSNNPKVQQCLDGAAWKCQKSIPWSHKKCLKRDLLNLSSSQPEPEKASCIMNITTMYNQLTFMKYKIFTKVWSCRHHVKTPCKLQEVLSLKYLIIFHFLVGFNSRAS